MSNLDYESELKQAIAFLYETFAGYPLQIKALIIQANALRWRRSRYGLYCEAARWAVSTT